MYNQHIILDFEMNPVSKSQKDLRKKLTQEIIEIGAVKLDQNYNVVDRFSCLVKPQYSSDVSARITKLTGITSKDVHKSLEFYEAVKKFMIWIGDEKTRLYSWSENDFLQFKNECRAKNVPLPVQVGRWMDFQIVFSGLMKLGNKHKRISLTEAATWYGISIDRKSVHRALYDAEITTKLVIPALNGEYVNQMKAFHENIVTSEKEKTCISLDELCGGILMQILQSMKDNAEYAS